MVVTWSISQSQGRGRMRPIASSTTGKVKALGNLQPVAYKIIQANIREAKRLDRLAREASGELEVVKVREYLAPTKEGFAPRGFGRKIKGLSPEKRALIAARREGRKAFFAELGVSV